MIRSTIIFCQLVLLVFCHSAKAQDKKSNRTYFAVIVSDMDQSTTWYKEKLKLEVKNTSSLPERGINQTNLLSQDFHVELIEIANSSKTASRAQGLFKIGKVVNHLDDWHSHLRKSKATFRGDLITDDITKMRTFIILDPDGNRIQFFGK